jgi:hypothetical protein
MHDSIINTSFNNTMCTVSQSIVTHMSIARQRLGKRSRNKYATKNKGLPLLDNGLIFYGPPQAI